MIQARRVVGGLLGLAVGDALGVPVEFEGRDCRRRDPVTSMRGGGTHGQVPGTWSDDTALTFCTVEALLGDYSVAHLGRLFARWLQEGYWTAGGDVFDVGATTSAAVHRIIRGVPPESSGSEGEDECGNGALMRILPVVLAFSRWSIPLMLDRVCEASAVTHAHQRSKIACCLFALVVRNLAFNRAAGASYRYAMEDAQKLFGHEPWRSERGYFSRILKGKIPEYKEEMISATGYVVTTLEAALWCLTTTRSYPDCVLRAVNLGDDTDTVAAVAGGMAGVAYGIESIPAEWLDALARKDELLEYAERLARLVAA